MAYKTKAGMGKVIAAAANPGLVRPSSRTASLSGKSRAALPKKGKTSFDPKTFLTRVGDGRSLAKYRKSQIVFSQGEIGDAVFYIQKGKVKVTVVSEQGKEAVVAILGTDEFFGEGCLAGQAQRISTVTAMTDASIVRLEKVAIVRVIHQEPAFS
ncbi:MAG: cyclic nucleotide-binding domain-containing protein, partial [Xanthobacteraceae bacterium]